MSPKGPARRPRRLDGRETDKITAFLFHAGGHEDPVRLAANAGQSFQGSIVLGMGFTFDDTDSSGDANSLAEMDQLLADDPRNGEVILPYIGGADLNESPTQAHHRYVINFAELAEADCRRRWPAVMALVEERVRADRWRQNDRGAREKWWQVIRPRPELLRAIAGLELVLVTSRISNAFAFTFLPAGVVYNEKTVVFPFAGSAPLAALQSRPHEVWTRFFSSTLKDDLQYTPSDCFETFPFPENWTDRADLEAAGRAYYEFRAQLMIDKDEGLTKTYHRFHDPEETDPRIAELRELHAAMDRAVLHAYGWDDVTTDCEFILDHEDDEESSRRKKPWRYRWPDAVRDDVLARLIELNGVRAEEEQRSGAAAAGPPRRRQKAAMGAQPEGLL